jgi:hypothetical protein
LDKKHANFIMKISAVYFLSLCSALSAGEADVIDVATNKKGDNLYDFSVTLLHQDTGWDHYANRWEVLDDKGTILATRTLYHPHVNEQPFTRKLMGIMIPAEVKVVVIRAHDSVHEYGGKIIKVELP